MTTEPPELRPGHVHPAFDRELDAAAAHLARILVRACGYSSAALQARLVQSLNEAGRGPYVSRVAGSKSTGKMSLPAPGTSVDCGGFSLELGSGRISQTLRQGLTNAFGFIGHWGLGLLSILAGMRPYADDRPATLVFGIGIESFFVNGDDTRFENYCRSGPVGPLRNGTRFLIQCAAPTGMAASRDFSYARHPLLTLVRQVPLGMAGRLLLLAKQLWLPCEYLLGILRCPPLALLGRDLAYARIARALDEGGAIESVVLTCSNCPAQLLWMREAVRFETHMAWYAQNWRPLVYRADGLEYDPPGLRHVKVDVHWVWTEAFVEFLRAHTAAGRVEVVGPILWYLPERRHRPADAIEVVVFDVNPFSDETGVKLGLLENYYRPGHLVAFMEGVLALREALERHFGLPVRIKLKHKRAYHPLYDRGYFDLIDRFVAEGRLQTVPPSDNMFALISGGHLVVVYPFSSPAYVADYLGVPAIYYDPTGTLEPTHEAARCVTFVQSREDLGAAAISAVAGREGFAARDATTGK